MKLDNDVACPNCGRIDGAPETVGYYVKDTGYLPSAYVSVLACSFCAKALAQTLRHDQDLAVRAR